MALSAHFTSTWLNPNSEKKVNFKSRPESFGTKQNTTNKNSFTLSERSISDLTLTCAQELEIDSDVSLRSDCESLVQKQN